MLNYIEDFNEIADEITGVAHANQQLYTFCALLIILGFAMGLLLKDESMFLVPLFIIALALVIGLLGTISNNSDLDDLIEKLEELEEDTVNYLNSEKSSINIVINSASLTDSGNKNIATLTFDNEGVPTSTFVYYTEFVDIMVGQEVRVTYPVLSLLEEDFIKKNDLQGLIADNVEVELVK